MAAKYVEDTSVTLRISSENPKTKAQLENMGKSMEKWRARLEEGRRRAKAYVEQERRKRGSV